MPAENPTENDAAADEARIARLCQNFVDRKARVGVVGLGFVGLPLAVVISDAGFRVTGFDVDQSRIDAINSGISYIHGVPQDSVAKLRANGRLNATADEAALRDVDAIVICVPTPLNTYRAPDMSAVLRTSESVSKILRRDQLVILESTTYPGTTRELVRPILERSGLQSGRDFFLAYSPERQDLADSMLGPGSLPKIVGGDGAAALRLARAFYDQCAGGTVPVADPDTAEAVKLTENIFRAVNIALVNELKLVYEAMDVDIWEVIEAAKTKPFGYMAFYPGPGLGGHSVPIDPFYLSWKAREFGISGRFIELAGEVNTSMPRRVVEKLARTLSDRSTRTLRGARILVIGLSYKKNVDDTRESASLRIIELLEKSGAQVEYYDPLVPVIGPSRRHAALAGRQSIELNPERIAQFDASLIVTDHDSVDYKMIVEHSTVVVDTRNVCARLGLLADNVVKA